MTELTRQELRRATRGGFSDFRPVVLSVGPHIHRLAQCICPETETILPTTLDHLLAIRDRLPLCRHDRPFHHWVVRQFLDLFAVGCEAARSARGDAVGGDTRRNRVSDLTRATLESLPRVHRDALLLHLGLDWPVAEVARALDLTEARAHVVLDRARFVLVQRLRHFYVRRSGRDVPAYGGDGLPEGCHAFRTHLRHAAGNDPADELDLEDLGHANDCPDCRVELEVYRKVKLRHANLSVLSPDMLWDTLLRHRGALLSEELMDLDREGAIALMHEIGRRPPPVWPWVLVFLLVLALGAWTIWTVR